MNYLLLIFPAVMWGTLGAFVRVIPLSSTQIALFRTILASATLIIIYIIRKNKINKIELQRNLPKFFLAGTAMAFNWIALFEAYKLTSVSVATVVYYLAPAFVIAASPFCFKEKLTVNKIIGLLAALVGMACVSLSAGIGEVSILGIVLALGGAILYAVVTLTNKSIHSLSGYESAMFELTIAAIVLISYSIVLTNDTWETPSGIGLGSLVMIGVFHTGICYAMYFTAVQRVKAQTSAIFSFADPFAALFVSVFILQEELMLIQFFGAVLIIGGAMVAELWSPKVIKLEN